MPRPKLVQVAAIERRILLIRGDKVIGDADLAAFYGVTTKRLNEQVKRNRDRLPEDFTFQLTSPEKSELVANCDHLSGLELAKTLPYAFCRAGLRQDSARSLGMPGARAAPRRAGTEAC